VRSVLRGDQQVIVADASVIVDMLLGPGSEAGDALADRFARAEAVCVPHLIDAEVPQVLRRFVLRGALPGYVGEALVSDLTALPFHRYAHSSLVARAFQMQANVTVYDGLYLALAEGLDCPLLTGDSALAGVPGCHAVVEVLSTSRS